MFDNQTVFVSGGTGSWGNELVKQLLEKYNPQQVIIYSRGEMKQWTMKKKFGDPRLKFIIGDVRDKHRLNLVMKNVDVVFHMAALKHVPVCEENPKEAVLTNITGTQNMIESAIHNDVKFFVQVSTDKAVDPFNLYGVTKSCAEKLIIAANTITDRTRFMCVRGGNVIGTNGSVIPLFKQQILTNNHITITDKRMTRFFLTLPQAIGLLFKAATSGVGGEVYVMRMPATTIVDLAQLMIKELGNKDTTISYTGIRPGEKIHELLLSRYEAPSAVEDEDYFVVLPHLPIPRVKERYSNFTTTKIDEFTSENARQLKEEELKELLVSGGWLNPTVPVPGISQDSIKDYTQEGVKWF